MTAAPVGHNEQCAKRTFGCGFGSTQVHGVSHFAKETAMGGIGRRMYGHTYCVVSAVLVGAAILTAAPGVLGADKDWNREINAARNTKWDGNGIKSRQISVEKLSAIADNEQAPVAARKSAAHNMCQILLELAGMMKDPAMARKMMSLCDQYEALSPDTNNTMIFATNRADAQVALLSLGQKDALPGALAAIDKMAALYAANPTYKRDPLLADCKRGQAYLYSGDPAKAITAFETFFAKGGKGSPQVYVDFIRAYRENDQDDKALAIAVEGVAKCNNLSGGELVEKSLAAVIAGLSLDDKVLGDVLPQVAASDAALDAILKKASKERSSAGDPDGALAFAKLAFDVSPLETLQPTTEWLTRCIRAKFMDVDVANAFVNYLNFGATGKDGAAGTADDLKNPLADVKSPLSDPVKAAIRKALAVTLPTEKTIYLGLRTRGTLHLLLGETELAIGAYSAAYRAAGIDQVRVASGLVPRALKARDGSLRAANQYLEYQKYGPAGADGKVGTADDLKSPVAVNLPALPDNVTAALRKIIDSPDTSMDGIEAKASACFALGDCKKGFSLTKAAFAAADVDDASQARALKDMAAAIKAYDGHILRANQYLAYQSRGAATKDAKSAAAPVTKNPLPEILAEVGL
jgi:hypothetical protein